MPARPNILLFLEDSPAGKPFIRKHMVRSWDSFIADPFCRRGFIPSTLIPELVALEKETGLTAPGVMP